MKAFVALGEVLLCGFGPCFSKTFVYLQELLKAEYHKVRHLNHWMLSGIYRVAKLDDMLHSLCSDNFEAAKPCDRSDMLFKLFFFVNDNNASCRATEFDLYVFIYDGC